MRGGCEWELDYSMTYVPTYIAIILPQPRGRYCRPFGSSITAGPPRKQSPMPKLCIFFCRCGWEQIIPVSSKNTYISERISDSQYLSISTYIYLCLSISLSSYLFACLSIYLSLSIYIYLNLSISIYIYLYLSITIYTYLSLSISIYLYLSIYLFVSICLSIYLSIHLSIYLCIYLSIHLSI